MNLKNSKLWGKMRFLKNNFLIKYEYFYAKHLKESKYEEYLEKRYSRYMDQFDYSKNNKLNFECPRTFTEKQQWLKLYDNNIQKSLLTDKYYAKKFFEKNIGSEFVIPLLKINNIEIFYSAKDINFDFLPNQFVLKCTHGSHMNIIVKDKSKLTQKDIKLIKRQLNKWLKINYAFKVGLELHYSNIKPAIIIEKYFNINDDLPDYKFFCFNGEPKFVWVDQNRNTNHKRTVFNLNYKKLPYNFFKMPDVDLLEKPKNFNKMIEISKKLSKGFIFSRVDLYNVGGTIYIGEITFSSGSGYIPLYPNEYDEKLGKLIKINQINRINNTRYRAK